MIELLRTNRIKWCCPLFMVEFFCIILFNAQYSMAEDLTVESIPELMQVSQCSAQGGSVSILGDYVNRSTDPCRMIVINSITAQTVRFDSGIWVAPAIFFNEGKKFLAATVKEVEGPTTYAIYDLNGIESNHLTTKDRIAPSESGTYFYSVNTLTAPARPIIYTTDFTVLKEFKVGKDVSSNWDATIIEDSLYILSDQFTIRLYRLPEFNIIGEYDIELGLGIPTHRLYCNENGTLCILSNYRSLGLINTKTGFTQTIPFEFIDKIHLSSDGNRVYSVRGRHEYMTVQEFEFDGSSFTEANLDTIVFAEYIPGPIKAIPESIIETPDGIAINLSLLHGEDPRTSNMSVATMFSSHQKGISKSLQCRVINGLTWQDNSEARSRLRCLTPLATAKAQIKEINSCGEEASNE